MKWKGKELATIGAICDAMEAISRAEDPRFEAAEFMRGYRLESPHADRNIGYLCGYFGNRLELQEIFGVGHPLLPNDRDVSPEEALQIGMKLGRAGFDPARIGDDDG